MIKIDSLVDYIIEQLEKKRSIKEIRAELLEKDYSKEVIHNSINQAEIRIEEKQSSGRKRFQFGDISSEIEKSKQAPDFTHIPAKDSDLMQKDVETEKRKAKGSIWLIIFLIIVFIWLGISFHKYFGTYLGKAADTIIPKSDEEFYAFCNQRLANNQNFDSETIQKICSIGKTIAHKNLNDKNLMLECTKISYNKEKIDQCTADLRDTVTSYKESKE